MNTSEYIFDRVARIVKKHKSRNPFELCEALGIRIKYAELTDTLDGYFFSQSRIKTVVLNSALKEEDMRIICAHELGHACLHSDTLTAMRIIGSNGLFNAKSTAEYEANLFAAELLITDTEIRRHTRNNSSIYSLSVELCVPVELLDFKLRSMQERGYTVTAPYLASSDFLKSTK